MSSSRRPQKEIIEEKSFGGSLMKRRKVGMIVNFWSHVDCLLDFSTKVFEYRIHDSQRDFRYIDLQNHREKREGSALDPGEKVIEVLEDKVIIRNACDTSGHFKSAIHLKPLESSVDFENWKAAFRKIVSIPANVEKCVFHSLPVFVSSPEEKHLLNDIMAGNQGVPPQSLLNDVWGLIQLRSLQLSTEDFFETLCEKVCCTVSFGSQSTFCDLQHENTGTQTPKPPTPLFKRFFISSQDASEILICVLCRSTSMRSVLQLIGKVYLWDLVRQLSTSSSSAVISSSIQLYSPGSSVIFGTAVLSYLVESLEDNVSNHIGEVASLDLSAHESTVSKPEFLMNDTATPQTKQSKDITGCLMFEQMISADIIASLALTLRVMNYPIHSFTPPLDSGTQRNEFLSRVFCVDISVVAKMAESDVLSCSFLSIQKESIFTINTCCYHPSYSLDAFGGSPSRLLSWQYQVYSQCWIANFARIAQHGHKFCNIKLQAVEQITSASFVSREFDDQEISLSRFPSTSIGESGNFEVTVMHDLNANPERTLKIVGDQLPLNVLNRFQDNLITLQGLRGNLIFLLRDRVRPFKLRSWGRLEVNSLIDQKRCTQWIHLHKYEDALAPSKKEKVFSEGYAVLVTVSLCFDRNAINLPSAALDLSDVIAPPQSFTEWLSAHPQSHIMGSLERSLYLHYLFQILCRRMVSCVAQLKVNGDCSVSWSNIPWNPDLPFPSEARGILVCFAHTYGVAPIYFHLQFAQELSDAFILSNYHNYSFIKLAVDCLFEVLSLASGFSNSDFAWFQSLTLTIFQYVSRSLYNVLCGGKIKQLSLVVVIQGYVDIFSKLNGVKTGIHMIESAIAKGIPVQTSAFGLSSQVGDFSKEHLMSMVVQDFVSLGDSVCLQTFRQSSDECQLPFPAVYIGQYFLDILDIFSKFLFQWKQICEDKECSKLIGCAVTGFYRRIICNAIDMRISLTLKGHDVLELWHCLQKIHSSLASMYQHSAPYGSFVDFTKLLAPIWLETLPETATALALSICQACKLDNLDICDEKKRISSSVIDGLQSSGIVVHEMQFVSQKCLASASERLRLSMMTSLVRIPIRAAQELQMWIQKRFSEILRDAHFAFRLSQMSKELILINQLCILCNDLAFLKDNVLIEAEGWARYYEELVAGSVSRKSMPGGINLDHAGSTDDLICFGPGAVEVIVTTGSTVGSGTDSDVFISLHGIMGVEPSGKQQLKSDHDTLETGCTDTFTIELSEALHQISKIEASHFLTTLLIF